MLICLDESQRHYCNFAGQWSAEHIVKTTPGRGMAPLNRCVNIAMCVHAWMKVPSVPSRDE